MSKNKKKKAENKVTVQLELKTIAYGAALEARLIPIRPGGGMDTEFFESFWNKFFPSLKDAEKFPDVKKLLESEN